MQKAFEQTDVMRKREAASSDTLKCALPIFLIHRNIRKIFTSRVPVNIIHFFLKKMKEKEGAELQ
jgi:hypothetical protein